MSRSQYDTDIDHWGLIRWSGAVKSALRGKRGQAALREMLAALDAMPVKELICDYLIRHDGSVCALGALAVARGKSDEARETDADDCESVSNLFNIAQAMVRKIEYENDEGLLRSESPTERWGRMRAWVASQITEVTS